MSKIFATDVISGDKIEIDGITYDVLGANHSMLTSALRISPVGEVTEKIVRFRFNDEVGSVETFFTR